MKAILLAAVLVASIVVAVTPVEARPYYSSGDHVIKLVVRFENDCWHEIYARATPKNNIHTVLNKQTIRNNDAPDNGPSEVLKLSWNFKASKMADTSATNEGRMRTYVTIELEEGVNGETVTKYLSFDAGRKTIDFGTFFMHTDSRLCD